MKKTLIGVAEMLPYRFYKNSRGLVVLAGTFTVTRRSACNRALSAQPDVKRTILCIDLIV